MSLRRTTARVLPVDQHRWLHAEELEADQDPPADPGLPRLMRAAVTAVHGPR